MKLSVPDPSLVVLIGASGSGKSTFALKHFRRTEVLSSDAFRGMVSDDENDQAATKDAFEALHFVARKRLDGGRLVVVDATNVQSESRASLVALARDVNALPVAIVLDVPERVCEERNRARPDRDFASHVVRQQTQQMRRGLRSLYREGFRHVFHLRGLEEIEAAEVERTRLWVDRKDETGPFDVIGDVHGCREELVDLLTHLGYEVGGSREAPVVTPPPGRRAIFLGDLVDRGPDAPGVLRIAMSMAASGTALCVPGNHDTKLNRKLSGRDVQVTHGLAETLEQMAKEPDAFREEVSRFIDALVSHYVLDGGKLVVAHAGMPQRLQGRASAKVREFALYGETTGETDEYGLPVRYDWASDYRGKAVVVYGHTPVPEPEWVNGTICIDTGCVFGGRLTALRYPEREIVSVPARRTWYVPVKPLPGAAPAEAPEPRDDLLDVADVMGKRFVTTRFHGSVTVREENATAALEVMSRFAVDPHWIVYLPPTMSPVETRKDGDLLEHPDEAFSFYRRQGVPRVLCEEKHMGSRAVVVVCRDAAVARTRFGAVDGKDGCITTRTGRPFFEDLSLERALLDRVRAAADRSGLWARLASDWFVLDAELMPWSAKAQELLRSQYAAVGASARASLDRAIESLDAAAARGKGSAELLERFRARRACVEHYVEAYRRYCWPVSSLADLRLAPFHLLAAEGKVYDDHDHEWHMETLAALARADDGAGDGSGAGGVLLSTRTVAVDLTDEASLAAGVRWWEDLTAAGGEGMVVKPLAWVVKGTRGLVQPALKVRGREYLRIIYGPEYTAPEHLERLRARGLGAKRSLALREYAVGLEGLHRFVAREPLYRVHECAFAVLALETEPVDPRL